MKNKYLKRLVPKALHYLLLAVILVALIIPALPLTSVFAGDGDPYYWSPVAGSGTGNWSDVAHWSSTDDGTGGDYATAPNATNPVYFATNSFTGAGQIVTVDAAAYCLSMDWTGATNNPTLAFGSFNINYGGDLTFIAAMNTTATTGTLMNAATAGVQTLTTNGLSLGNRISKASFSGATLSLADDLTITNTENNSISWGAGTFLTNDHTINTAGGISLSLSNAKVFTMGASSITCSDFEYTGTNLTFTANTGSITVTGTGGFDGGNIATYNDLIFTGSSHALTGAFTCANLTRHASSHASTDNISFQPAVTVTVSGTTTFDGGARATQLLVKGGESTLGAAATLTTANLTASNTDFMDITLTNAKDFSAQTDIGDCGGNTNITFPAASPQYWHSNTGSWSNPAKWFLATNGGGGAGRIPLPQDDVYIDLNSIDTGTDNGGSQQTITIDILRIGKSVSFSGVLHYPIIDLDSAIENFGNFTLDPNIAYITDATYNNRLRGRGNYTFTSAGKLIYALNVYAPTGTYSLADDLHVDLIIVRAGTLDFNDKDAIIRDYLVSDNTYSCTHGLSMGSGNINLISITTTTKWSIDSTTVFNAESSTIIFSRSSGATGQTFSGGGFAYHNFRIDGASEYAVTISGSNVFDEIYMDGALLGKTLNLPNATTTVIKNITRDVAGTNLINITSAGAGSSTITRTGLIINSTGTLATNPTILSNGVNNVTVTGAGTFKVRLPKGVTGTAFGDGTGGTATLTPDTTVNIGSSTVGTITTLDTGATTGIIVITLTEDITDSIGLDYLNLTRIPSYPVGCWYAGTHSTDSGGNTNWTFDDPALTAVTSGSASLTMNKDGVTGGVLSGDISDVGGTVPSEAYFEYGLTVAYGSETTHVNTDSASTFSTQTNEDRHIICMGDSLTYPNIFEDKLKSLLGDGWQIDNRGVRGETTTQMLARFTAQVTDELPEYVVIWGGANDVGTGVAAATIEANLQDMYDAAHAAGIKVISINITPTKGYAGYWSAAKQIVLDTVNTWIANTATNIDYRVNAYSLLEDSTNPDTFQSRYTYDYLHLSWEGYELIGTTIYNTGDWTTNDYFPTNLTPGATYHFREVIENANAGSPFYGADQTFTFTMPTIATGTSNVSGNNTVINGSISNMGVASNTYSFFQYGNTPALGSSTALQTVAAIGAITSTIPSPGSSNILYYRIGTTNGATTIYGSTQSLSIPSGVGGMLLRTLLRVVLAGAIMLGVIIVGKNGAGLQLLMAALVGLLAFTIIDLMLISLI